MPVQGAAALSQSLPDLTWANNPPDVVAGPRCAEHLWSLGCTLNGGRSGEEGHLSAGFASTLPRPLPLPDLVSFCWDSHFILSDSYLLFRSWRVTARRQVQARGAEAFTRVDSGRRLGGTPQSAAEVVTAVAGCPAGAHQGWWQALQDPHARMVAHLVRAVRHQGEDEISVTPETPHRPRGPENPKEAGKSFATASLSSGI